MLDTLLIAADNALRTLSGATASARPTPAGAGMADLSPDERRLSGALMRVNHVGEVCAQALYHGQSIATKDRLLRQHFERAAREETDHLAWTQRRLDELGSRGSVLNPLWYAGSFGIGALAALLGDRASLGFVAETERQVEGHLKSHLEQLPAEDLRSRAIVEAMCHDEVGHGQQAQSAGAASLPGPVRELMRRTARIMTHTSYRL